MTTQRQIDALAAAFEKGNPWDAGPPGTRGRAGGAFARMIDDLKSTGLLYRPHQALPQNTITAKGLRLLLEWYKARQRRSPILAEKVKVIEARLPGLDAKEAEFAQQQAAEKAERQRVVDKRAAGRKARRVAAFRAFFAERGMGHSFADDDAMLEFVDALVRKDDAL